MNSITFSLDGIVCHVTKLHLVADENLNKTLLMLFSSPPDGLAQEVS